MANTELHWLLNARRVVGIVVVGRQLRGIPHSAGHWFFESADCTFTYHNGAESYYAARAFRGALKV